MTIKRIWVKDEKIVRIEPRDDYKPLFKAHQKVIGQAPVVTPLGGFVFPSLSLRPEMRYTSRTLIP
jgi:hypothetical protein